MSEIVLSTAVLGSLGAALAGLIDLAARHCHVEEDPLLEAVEQELPGANCGNCGYAGCRAFAEQLVGSRDPDLFCPAGGLDLSRRLAEVLDMEVVEREIPVAVVLCRGFSDQAEHLGRYVGVDDCLAAVLVGGTSLLCPFGCVGLGSCAAVCRYEGIRIHHGIAEVDDERCVGCGECVEACPLELIELLPRSRRVFVACSSRDAGRTVKKTCAVGCIGCRKCVKACDKKAISCPETLARIDPEVCDGCGACIESCPTDTILAAGPAPSALLRAGVHEVTCERGAP